MTTNSEQCVIESLHAAVCEKVAKDLGLSEVEFEMAVIIKNRMGEVSRPIIDQMNFQGLPKHRTNAIFLAAMKMQIAWMESAYVKTLEGK